MDGHRFDALARAWADHSRRKLLQRLGASTLAGLGGWGALEATDARRRRKRDQRDDVLATGKKKGKGKGKGKGNGKKKKKGADAPETGPCPQGEKRCIDVCVKLAFDPKHCGQCGVVCPPSHPRCDFGVCSVQSTCSGVGACGGMRCGTTVDSCGQTVSCGTCAAGEVCDAVTSTCRCLSQCCRNSDCASGECQGGSCCPTDAQACIAAGVQCGASTDPVCGRGIQCGNCPSGEECRQGQCRPICQEVCCDDTDCEPGDVCTGGASPTCCRPEHSSVTCFPTLGTPFCGTVQNNCRQPVACGGCPASGEICAADNRCGSCPVGTQAIKGDTPDGDVCCPDAGVCTRNGRTICCNQSVDICGNGPSICCDGGAGCGTPSGGICRRPGTASSCCQGSCQFQGIDFCGEFGRCQ